MKHIKIYSDGASRGNPGLASYGFVLIDAETDQEILRKGEYLGEKTNNQAEYLGIYYALAAALELEAEKVDCYLDSELAVKQLNGVYKVKNPELAEIFVKVRFMTVGKDVSFYHVRREKNKEADAMANYVLDHGKKVGQTFVFDGQ